MSNMFEIYNDLIDEVISVIKTGVSELVDATTPYAEPRIVKHDLPERAALKDFFAIVSAGPMEILRHKTPTLTDHNFRILIDLNYYSDDFADGQEKNLLVSGKIYDLLHNTTLNNKCRMVDVEFFPVPPGQIENLYAITTRLVVTCERSVQR